MVCPRCKGSGSIDRSEPTTVELEIIKSIAEGLTTNEIAELRGRKPSTIDAHRFNLMRKLGLHSKVEVVHYAIRHGIVQTKI